MEKNQKYLPIGILVGIIVLVVLVILIKNFAPNTIKQQLSEREKQNTEVVNSEIGEPFEGFFEGNTALTGEGYTDEEAEYEDTVSESEETDPDDNETVYVDNEVMQTGLTKEEAWSIDFNTEYVSTMVQEQQKHWFALHTTDKDVIYRVFIDPDINDLYIMESVEIAVYDEIGIKVQEKTTSYGKECFLDIFLTPNTKYYIRVNVENLYQSSGEYMMWVQEIPRDPATVIEKGSAVSVEIGQEYMGALNSSFNNWYSCVFPQGGEYSFVIHNIDVGCTVYFEGATNRQVLFTGYTQNENSNTVTFDVNSGDEVFIELSPGEDTANGRYILKIEKK